MALTNAERQARYRARLKRNASTEAIGSRVHRLVDQSVDILWNVFNRPSPEGHQWTEMEEFRSKAEYRRHLVEEPGRLVATSRDMLWVSHLLQPDEKQTLQALVEVADAMAMLPRDRTG